MYSYGPPHMPVQKQDDQQEHTFSSYVRIRDVVLKTCLGRWTISRSGERGSGISVLPARHDDDDDVCVWDVPRAYIYNYIWVYNNTHIYIYTCSFVVCWWEKVTRRNREWGGKSGWRGGRKWIVAMRSFSLNSNFMIAKGLFDVNMKCQFCDGFFSDDINQN